MSVNGSNSEQAHVGSANVVKSGLFSFRAPLVYALSLGDFLFLWRVSGSVVTAILGQVDDMAGDETLDRHLRRVDVLRGSITVDAGVPVHYNTGIGHVLAEFREDAVRLDLDRFHSTGQYQLRVATDQEVQRYLDASCTRVQSGLCIGTMRNSESFSRVLIKPSGLARPTGLFGQSGSGKSYALAVLVEELHYKTRANVVVLDPNGDFSPFDQKLRSWRNLAREMPRHSFTAEERAFYVGRHRERGTSTFVLSCRRSGIRHNMGLDVNDLDDREFLFAIGLDPSVDIEADLVLRRLRRNSRFDLRSLSGQSAFSGTLSSSLRGAVERIRLGVANSGVMKWPVFRARGDGPGLVRLLESQGQWTIVVDLSCLSQVMKAVVSSVVLRVLWARRQGRRPVKRGRPTLVFVDEAHHLFPSSATSPAQRLTLEWGAILAGEGRKYALYCVLASQLPSKMHEHVLTQCGNVILMKMMSQSNIDALCSSFSFVSHRMLELATTFDKGDALIAGPIVPTPLLVRFEGRKTQEGGGDAVHEWKA